MCSFSPCLPGPHHRPLPSVVGEGSDSSVSSPALVIVRAFPALVIVQQTSFQKWSDPPDLFLIHSSVLVDFDIITVFKSLLLS